MSFLNHMSRRYSWLHRIALLTWFMILALVFGTSQNSGHVYAHETDINNTIKSDQSERDSEIIPDGTSDEVTLQTTTGSTTEMKNNSARSGKMLKFEKPEVYHSPPLMRPDTSVVPLPLDEIRENNAANAKTTSTPARPLLSPGDFPGRTGVGSWETIEAYGIKEKETDLTKPDDRPSSAMTALPAHSFLNHLMFMFLLVFTISYSKLTLF
ncbi:uncharacterized protein LOC106466852 [Limulus polyphemus]|uniref:Uncharacterized protein LOC106466852 n=1 Tax=Limulus polyphemus TaxID=6850 RepID=A0ABM1BID7_LIMPO|nr:uncharacterized protein LOC106466852 [Limulus polyphemus]